MQKLKKKKNTEEFDKLIAFILAEGNEWFYYSEQSNNYHLSTYQSTYYF